MAYHLEGQKFGRLLVISDCPGSQTKKRRWKCICDCGTDASVTTDNLMNGKVTSCGCYRSDYMRAKRTRHGMSETPIYSVWKMLVQRCTNPANKDWLDYGGRGITICEEWRLDFAAFYRDLGDRPEGHTIERIDNSKGYEPGNCRWASWSDQAFNRRPKGQGRKSRGL